MRKCYIVITLDESSRSKISKDRFLLQKLHLIPFTLTVINIYNKISYEPLPHFGLTPKLFSKTCYLLFNFESYLSQHIYHPSPSFFLHSSVLSIRRRISSFKTVQRLPQSPSCWRPKRIMIFCGSGIVVDKFLPSYLQFFPKKKINTSIRIFV